MLIGIVMIIAGNTTGYVDGFETHALFNTPTGIAIDSNNILYVCDSGNNIIRVIAQTYAVTTLAGGGGRNIAGYLDGMGTSALFNSPEYIAVGKTGVVFVSDTGNNIIRAIQPSGIICLRVPWVAETSFK